jgi:hypothetical protein
MSISLDELITTHQEELLDEISKEAVRHIPSYAEAPLRLTMDRVERWLRTLAESIRQNDPHMLSNYLMAIGQERREEGYPIGELHAIVHLTERHLLELVAGTYSDPVECNGQTALLTAVMDSARMTLSVTYVLSWASTESGQQE